MNKSPAFQFYPADYLADMQVRLLSWASRGLYIDLLCYCWREGYIPSDSSAIAQLCGCHDLAIIEPCLLLFSESEENGKLIHKRLEKEREKQNEHRKERAEAGKKGAETRWGKGKTPRNKTDGKANGSANGSAIVLPMAKNGSSSSSSTSVINRELPFSSSCFAEAWQDWQQHRKEKKLPLTATTIKSQFKKLRKMGEQRAIAALTNSTENGYTGIFEPKDQKPAMRSIHEPQKLRGLND